MNSLKFSYCLLYLLLCSLAVVLGACASHIVSETTTTTATSPTAIATQATMLPTTTIATQATALPTITISSSMLNITLACAGGTKQNEYGVDVIHGKVCAQTLPGATLTIQVVYCGGKPDPSSVLQGSVTADAHGFYQWNWTPQPDCNGQPIWGWKVALTAQLDGQTANAEYQDVHD